MKELKTKRFNGYVFEQLNSGLGVKPIIKEYREINKEYYFEFRCVLEPDGWAVYGKPRTNK